MIDFIISNIMVMDIFTNPDQCSILGSDFNKILQEIFTMIQLAIPVLVVVLCSVDFAKAVIAQDEKDMKKAQSDAIKRLMIGAAIFFVPTIINLVLKYAGFISGTCNIG